jgi:hypothetical protein
VRTVSRDITDEAVIRHVRDGRISGFWLRTQDRDALDALRP